MTSAGQRPYCDGAATNGSNRCTPAVLHGDVAFRLVAADQPWQSSDRFRRHRTLHISAAGCLNGGLKRTLLEQSPVRYHTERPSSFSSSWRDISESTSKLPSRRMPGVLLAISNRSRASSTLRISARQSFTTLSMTASTSPCPVLSTIWSNRAAVVGADSIKSPVTQLLTVKREIGMPLASKPMPSKWRVFTEAFGSSARPANSTSRADLSRRDQSLRRANRWTCPCSVDCGRSSGEWEW